jgi:hypothetical protein
MKKCLGIIKEAKFDTNKDYKMWFGYERGKEMKD